MTERVDKLGGSGAKPVSAEQRELARLCAEVARLKTKRDILKNSRGHVVSETDAFGTPLAPIITTTWDSICNLPTERAQPGLTKNYAYSSGC